MPSDSNEIKFCPRCGKSDCTAPPLVNPEYAGGACAGRDLDLSAFEDDCGNQIEFRGRPAKEFDRSQVDENDIYGIVD